MKGPTTSSKPRRTKDINRANARRRGAAFEKRVARDLDGDVYHGLDGDVDAKGWRLECKFRTGVRLEDLPNPELASFFQQIQRYRTSNPAKKFALAFSGGKTAGNEVWVAIPLADFNEMADRMEDDRNLDYFRRKYPDIENRLLMLVLETLKDEARL